jgi:hypothetical protein
MNFNFHSTVQSITVLPDAIIKSPHIVTPFSILISQAANITSQATSLLITIFQPIQRISSLTAQLTDISHPANIRS